MSKRPMFWIHRTRLFWFGLGVLVVMFGVFVMACLKDVEITHERVIARHHRSSVVVAYSGALREAGLELSRWKGGIKAHWSSPASWPSSNWSHNVTDNVGFRVLPSFKRDLFWGVEVTIFIPIWPFIVLWCLLWPYWMHRSEKKMVERYRRAGAAGDEAK